MSRTTREINKVTSAIINTSIKLIVYALVVLLLYEGVTKGYDFGHEVFYSTAVAAAPGVDKTITIDRKASVMETAQMLERRGMIKNAYVFMIQSKFYAYEIKSGTFQLNTSMTSVEILKKLQDESSDDGIEAGKS